jgi:acyl-CoA dehydrogenase
MAAVRRVAEVAAAGAEANDRDATFPAAPVAELHAAGLLGAALPADMGGCSAPLPALLDVAAMLARGCGSTAMVWAMHQLQIVCVVRHSEPGSRPWRMLANLVATGGLVASVTSEEGVGGNIHASRAAVLAEGDRCSLDKRATTVSYGRQAGAYLVTARRTPDAPADDQVAVLVSRDQTEVEVTGGWNPMGMRATDSPAMRLHATFSAHQILPQPFADVATASMIPLSHLLWSAVWTGLATEAFERARRLLRSRHRDGAAGNPHLARAHELLCGLEATLAAAARDYEPCYAAGRQPTMHQLVRFNALKVAASETSLRVAEEALTVCGMAGYREDGEYSVARILRDLYSARLMVGNDRLRAANATQLLAMRRR